MATQAKAPRGIEVRESSAGSSAFIRGTRVRVADLVQLYLLMQQEVIVERVLRSLPHLTAEQVHDALDYWKTHKEDIEIEVQAEDALVEKLQST